jgi:hypothetical protein
MALKMYQRRISNKNLRTTEVTIKRSSTTRRSNPTLIETKASLLNKKQRIKKLELSRIKMAMMVPATIERVIPSKTVAHEATIEEAVVDTLTILKEPTNQSKTSSNLLSLSQLSISLNTRSKTTIKVTLKTSISLKIMTIMTTTLMEMKDTVKKHMGRKATTNEVKVSTHSSTRYSSLTMKNSITSSLNNQLTRKNHMMLPVEEGNLMTIREAIKGGSKISIKGLKRNISLSTPRTLKTSTNKRTRSDLKQLINVKLKTRTRISLIRKRILRITSKSKINTKARSKINTRSKISTMTRRTIGIKGKNTKKIKSRKPRKSPFTARSLTCLKIYTNKHLNSRRAVNIKSMTKTIYMARNLTSSVTMPLETTWTLLTRHTISLVTRALEVVLLGLILKKARTLTAMRTRTKLKTGMTMAVKKNSSK